MADFRLTTDLGRTVTLAELQAALVGDGVLTLEELGAPVAVSGSLALISNAALHSLFDALDTLGLITDNTT